MRHVMPPTGSVPALATFLSRNRSPGPGYEVSSCAPQCAGPKGAQNGLGDAFAEKALRNSIHCEVVTSSVEMRYSYETDPRPFTAEVRSEERRVGKECR